jgi:hypothetical protein
MSQCSSMFSPTKTIHPTAGHNARGLSSRRGNSFYICSIEMAGSQAAFEAGAAGSCTRTRRVGHHRRPSPRAGSGSGRQSQLAQLHRPPPRGPRGVPAAERVVLLDVSQLVRPAALPGDRGAVGVRALTRVEQLRAVAVPVGGDVHPEAADRLGECVPVDLLQTPSDAFRYETKPHGLLLSTAVSGAGPAARPAVQWHGAQRDECAVVGVEAVEVADSLDLAYCAHHFVRAEHGTVTVVDELSLRGPEPPGAVTGSRCSGSISPSGRQVCPSSGRARGPAQSPNSR